MVRRVTGRRSRSRSGAAAAELALLLPFICFLLVLAIDFGRIFFPSLTMSGCARNGAFHDSDPVLAAESPWANSSQAATADSQSLTQQPTVTTSSGTASDGSPLASVQINYTFQSLTNFPGIPNNTPLQRTIRMRVAPTVPTF
jgi:Flp pilus assembly protein TadG